MDLKLLQRKRSKSAAFLEGRRIESVENEPHSLVLRLDDGHKFRIVASMSGFDGPAYLDFLFDDKLGGEG